MEAPFRNLLRTQIGLRADAAGWQNDTAMFFGQYFAKKFPFAGAYSPTS